MRRLSILILIIINFFYIKSIEASVGGEKMLKKEYLNKDSTIKELLTYPSIKEFSKFILLSKSIFPCSFLIFFFPLAFLLFSKKSSKPFT